MTTLPIALPLRRLASRVALAASLAASLPHPCAALAGGGGTGADDELTVRPPSLAGAMNRAAAARPNLARRGAAPFNVLSTVTPNDTFPLLSLGFQELDGSCNPRGWTGQDLTTRVFAHVSGRFTINDGFVNMGTRALWVGADSTSALDEIEHWVNPYGYGNGWSQRLTSPGFSLASNPGAKLTFDVSMQLRRNIDTAPTSVFTPYGLASGKISNDCLSAQAKKTDGSWAFLTGRWSVAGGPAWDATPPLFANRWGSSGTGDLNFSIPRGAAVDDSGNVYVADSNNNRIVKYSGSGRFLTKWGSLGSGPGQFNTPQDIAVDDSFHVFVTDGNHRVQKFTNAGVFLRQWGSFGAGPGSFSGPRGIAVDAAHNVYVADNGNWRVQKFNSMGVFALQWGTFGSGAGQFQFPMGIATNAAGQVYVTDGILGTVQMFSGTGSFITSWGAIGSGDGQFNSPAGLDVDRDGNVWVADQSNHRIQKFTSSGGFLLKTGVFGTAGGHFFNGPTGIAVGRMGDVYVSDTNNHRIEWFAIGGPIAGERTFKYEVHLDGDGNQDLGLAEPLQVRVVVQSNQRFSSEDGSLFAGQDGVILVDNVKVQNSGGGDILAPVDFEDNTTGAWTLSALNQGYVTTFNVPSVIRDTPPPATSVTLRSGFDPYDPSCAWTFLSPGDTVATGLYARIVSPWMALTPADSQYIVTASGRLNSLIQARFLWVYARAKRAGDVRPRQVHSPGFVYYGTDSPDESAAPFDQGLTFRFPQDFSGAYPPAAMDSVQLVFEVVDQPERLLGLVPEQRPTAHVPILDDIQLLQIGVDSDYDGVADAYDACPTVCAAGQDADGDGCVDPTATLHHVESWANGIIHYTINEPGSAPAGPFRVRLATPAADFAPAEVTAVEDGFNTWRFVPGANVPLVEDPPTGQTTASAADGVNLVTRNDPEFQFPPGVLGVTPTTSFTRRTMYGDRIVLPGEIVDADMILNPKTPWTTTGEAGKLDLQSVVTHEAGHFLGLSHTGVLDATMFFVIQPSQDARTLTDDDRAAIAAAYPAGNFGTGFGTIKGSVIRGQTGFPLPGALVEAVLLGGGGALMDTTASDYTAEDGTYALRRLPAGSYAVRVTPLDGNIGGFPLTPEYISQRLVNIAQTVFLPEWWNVGESDRDDPALRDPVAVLAGQTVTGINITTTVDTIPPFVTATLPANAATGITVDTPILVNFSEPVISDSIPAAFRVRKDGVPPSLGGTGQLLGGKNFVFTPTNGLEFSSTYEIEISPALRDLEGLALADTFRTTFTTQAQPPLSIADIQPRSAPVGGLITITGTGFYPTNDVQVSFANCDAITIDPANVTTTSIVVAVPPCAQSGPVQVTTPSGTSNSFAFTVLPPTPQAAPVANGAPVALGFAPTDAAVSPDGQTAYATGDGAFASVDLSVPLRPVTTHLQGTFRGLALTPDGGRAVIARPGTGDVLVLGATRGVNLGLTLATISVGGSPGGVAISPNGRRAYVPDLLTGVTHELDIDPGSIAPYSLHRDLPTPGAVLSGGVAVSLDGGTIYLSSSNQGLLSVKLATDPAVITVLNPDPNAGGIAVVPSGAEVLAPGATFASSLVTVSFPTQGGFAPGSVFVGGAPRDVGVSPAGQSAYVVDSQTDELQVVNVDPGTGSAYHTKVSSVGTGHSPLSIGVSSLSPVLAVANYADHTLSIYSTGGANTSVRGAVPDLAMPGGQVAVITPDDIYSAGTTVDLGDGPFSAQYPSGQGVGFTVPTFDPRQRSTSLTLQAPAGGERSAALPFSIVDPIGSFVPRDGAVSLVPNPTPLTIGETFDLRHLRLSPDGRLLAIGRTRSAGSEAAQVQFWWAGSSANGRSFGTFQNSASVSGPISDIEFTGDGRHLWALDQTSQVQRFNAHPDSLAAYLGTIPLESTEPVPTEIGADPLARFMFVGGSSRLLVYTLNGSLLASIASAAPVRSLASTPNGQYLVVGGGSNAKIYSSSALYVSSATPLATTPIHAGATFSRLAISTDGRRAVGIGTANQIAVWNLDTGAGALGQELFFGAVAGAPSPISEIVPAPNGTGFLLGCTGCGSLVRLNVATLPPTVTPATLAINTESLARSADGRRLWIGQWSANINAATVRLFNLGEGTQLAIVEGQNQLGLPGQPLARPIRVRFTDAQGHPQEGLAARFRFAAPGASGLLDGQFNTEAVKLTDVNGEAEVAWTLPAALGALSLIVDGLGVPATPLAFAVNVVPTDADIVPAVVEFGPAAGATNVNTGSALFARFNQRMNTGTIPGKMHVSVGNTPNVTGALTFQDNGRVAIFQPRVPLLYSAPCTLFVDAGAADTDGQLTASRQSAYFTVQAPPPLAVASLSPPAAGTGATVVITGEGFGTSANANVVTFGGVLAPVSQASLTSLTTAVPVNVAAGNLPVVVKVGTATSAPVTFTVLTPNTDPGNVVGSVSDNSGVSRIAFTPDGSRAYVTNPDRNSVSVLDIATATIVQGITVGLAPKGIAILPDGSRAYVANSGSNDLSVIDTNPGSNTYNTVVATIPVGEGPVDVVVSGIGPKVFVANSKSGTVSIVDANPGNGTFDQVVTTVNCGSGCTGVEVTPDGARMYVGTGNGIVMVDLGSLVVTTVNSGTGCTGIEITPDGTILLALMTNGQLIAIDTTPGSSNFNKVVCTVNTGVGTGSVGISPDGALGYVTSTDGNSVSVYQIIKGNLSGQSSFVPGPSVTLTLQATIPVGSAPSDVALDPTGSSLGLVPNSGSGTITFIGLPSTQPVVTMGFDVSPNSINLKSMGKWVSGTLTPPTGFSAADIVVSSIRLNGIVPVDPDGPVSIDSQGLKVKFSRSALQLVLTDGDHVPVNVTGVIAGRNFAGVAYVKVKAGKVTHPHVAEIVDPRFAYPVQWNPSSGVQVEWVALLHSLDHGATWQLDASHLPNSGQAMWNPPNVLCDSVRVAVVEVETSAPGDTLVTGVLGVSDYFRISTPTDVEPLPARLEFSPITPTPSLGQAALRYGLPRPARVDLEIFDIQGRRLRVLSAGEEPAGWHQAFWRGETDDGAFAGSGLYFARLRAEGKVFRQRLIWIR